MNFNKLILLIVTITVIRAQVEAVNYCSTGNCGFCDRSTSNSHTCTTCYNSTFTVASAGRRCGASVIIPNCEAMVNDGSDEKCTKCATGYTLYVQDGVDSCAKDCPIATHYFKAQSIEGSTNGIHCFPRVNAAIPECVTYSKTEDKCAKCSANKKPETLAGITCVDAISDGANCLTTDGTAACTTCDTGFVMSRSTTPGTCVKMVSDCVGPAAAAECPISSAEYCVKGKARDAIATKACTAAITIANCDYSVFAAHGCFQCATGFIPNNSGTMCLKVPEECLTAIATEDTVICASCNWAMKYWARGVVGANSIGVTTQVCSKSDSSYLVSVTSAFIAVIAFSLF